MFFLVILFVILYGWVEFEVFAAMSDAIGGLWTFLGIFLTGFIGLSLLKSQSKSVLSALQSHHADPHIGIAEGISSGIALLCGAVFMLLPGYVTDGIGLLCFIPGVRVYIGMWMLSRLRTKNFSQSASSFHFSGFGAGEHNPFQTDQRHRDDADPDTIEGDFTEKK